MTSFTEDKNNWNLKYERFGSNKDLYREYDERHTSDIKTKVIMKGVYRGRHFMIGASNLGYPVAYIEAFNDDPCIDINKPDSWNAEALGLVNGSSNYYGGAYWDKTDSRKYVGWDYGHCDDFMGHEPPERAYMESKYLKNSHVWTLAEILMEIAVAWTEIEVVEQTR